MPCSNLLLQCHLQRSLLRVKEFFTQLSRACATAFNLKRSVKSLTTLKETTTFPWGGGYSTDAQVGRCMGLTLTLFETETTDSVTLFKKDFLGEPFNPKSYPVLD